VAVDPDEALKAHAEQHGWSVISLRAENLMIPNF
jgi:phosphoserine phosphatase